MPRMVNRLYAKIHCGREILSGNEQNLSVPGFGLAARPGLNKRGGVMSERSYYWHQAQVCMSLARVTDDPFLKERYEDLALDFAQNAELERLESSDLESGLGNTNRV
jgi:hypothetical protein